LVGADGIELEAENIRLKKTVAELT